MRYTRRRATTYVEAGGQHYGAAALLPPCVGPGFGTQTERLGGRLPYEHSLLLPLCFYTQQIPWLSRPIRLIRRDWKIH